MDNPRIIFAKNFSRSFTLDELSTVLPAANQNPKRNSIRFADNRETVATVSTIPAPNVSLSVHEIKDIWDHAVLLVHMHEYDDAITSFRRIIRRSPKSAFHAPLWANIGICHAVLGEYDTASKYLNKAIDIDHECAIYWFLLSLARFELRVYRDAKRYMETCRSLFPVRIEKIDYSGSRLDFALDKGMVDDNIRVMGLAVSYLMTKVPVPVAEGLERIPAGRLFLPPVL